MLFRSTVFLAILFLSACDTVEDPPVLEQDAPAKYMGFTITVRLRDPRGGSSQTLRGVTDVYLPHVGYSAGSDMVHLVPFVRLDSENDCLYGSTTTHRPYTVECPWDWHVIPANENAKEAGQSGWKSDWSNHYADFHTEPVDARFGDRGPEEQHAAFAFFTPGSEWLVTDENDTVRVHVLDEVGQSGTCMFNPDDAVIGRTSTDFGTTTMVDRCLPRFKPREMMVNAEGGYRSNSGSTVYSHFPAPPWKNTSNYVQYYHPRDRALREIDVLIKGRLVNASTGEVITELNSCPQGHSSCLRTAFGGAWTEGPWFQGSGDLSSLPTGTFRGSFVVTGYFGWTPSELLVTLNFEPRRGGCSSLGGYNQFECSASNYPDYKSSRLIVRIPVDYSTTRARASAELDWRLRPSG